MTVKELKEALKTYPDDAEVIGSSWDDENTVQGVYGEKKDGKVYLRLWKNLNEI